MKGTILYVGGFELPDNNAAAQRVIANGKILRSLGYDIIFVGINKGYNSQDMAKIAMTYEGFTYYQLKYPETRFEWIKYLTSIKYIKHWDPNKISHIIAYNYPAVGLWKLKQFCSKHKIKLIADCTEWYTPTGNLVFRLIKAFDVHLRMKYLHPKMNGIIAISKYLNDYYKNRNCRVIQVPPLVDLTMHKWNVTVNSSSSGNDSISLIYAGSPGERKDRLDILLKSLSILAKEGIFFSFQIVGISEDEFLYSTKNLDWDFIRTFCTFSGRLTHGETVKAVSKADFQLFLRNKNLSNTAGFPTKFVESVSCGTPVLSNLTSNIDDYLQVGKNGFLIDASSNETLLTTLRDALTVDRITVQNMKEYCRTSGVFHYSNFISLFDDFFKKL